MNRIGVLTLLFLLSACVTAQDAPPVAAVEKAPCPETPGEAWRLHLQAVIDPSLGDASHFRDCAARTGHVDAMTSLGTQLTQWPRKPGDFERGMRFLQNAAIAGDPTAQRMLALKYGTGAYGNAQTQRNAYLALFWKGVVTRDRAGQDAPPKISAMLGRYRELLSERSREGLVREIAAWRPGRPEPQHYTFDILMTNVVAGSGRNTVWSERGMADAVLDYGLAEGLPDAGLLALFRGQAGDVDRVPQDVLDSLVANGSFLALTLKLRNVTAQEGREEEELVLIVQLLSRLGLDLRYLQPQHDQLLSQFSETGDIVPLMNAIAAGSQPERQILATIAAMNACSAETTGVCDRILTRVKPLISPVALSFLDFIRAMENCTAPSEKLRCLLDNGGMTALRDIIVNDTIDLGGRSV
ncbi:sel1 repeat family protein [Hwanghaeella grinnelliae]|uniref:Sel1 repeat family protein n=1 Tax=Hwanghaeella grinnelliae TaxID=2500179 RepID=A0A437QP00_9PROT|nr:sel1 repeat family protein [Hwanghaeella grinnelliae]RVU36195.1 sel1 repeat family protein [Hwanghaeella grinnelliae]